MCCTKYTALHGAEETPTGASSSSATAAPALLGAPGQRQGIPSNPLILLKPPLLALNWFNDFKLVGLKSELFYDFP